MIQVHAGAVNRIKSDCAKAVNGYPTLAKVRSDGGVDAMYEGPRDYHSMTQFIDAHFEPEQAKRSIQNEANVAHGVAHGVAQEKGHKIPKN